MECAWHVDSLVTPVLLHVFPLVPFYYFAILILIGTFLIS